jgi:hypothetical protein
MRGSDPWGLTPSEEQRAVGVGSDPSGLTPSEERARTYGVRPHGSDPSPSGSATVAAYADGRCLPIAGGS